MHLSLLDALAALATALPYLAILFILLHYNLRRARWRRNMRKGLPNKGFCPSTAALGIAFLITQVFWRPSVTQMVQVQRVEDTDEDVHGDPDSPQRLLHRQLRRVRRGLPLKRLVVRLGQSRPHCLSGGLDSRKQSS